MLSNPSGAGDASITKRTQAEETLRESEARYRSLFDKMTEGFALHEIICDEQGEPCDYRFLDLNPAFERLTGLNRADVIGRTLREVLPEEEPYWIKSYAAVALTGKSVHFDRHSAALNKHYDVLAYCPALGQFAVLFTDITERKAAEEALRASEERFRVTFEDAPVGMAIGIGDGVIAKVNRALCRMCGFTEEELVGRHVRDLTHPDDRELSVPLVRRLLAGEISSFAIQKRYLRKNGEFFWAQATTALAYDSAGKAAFALGVVEDITQRKRAEQDKLEMERRLLHAQKLESIGLLASGIAHDFNNILAGIMGYAELALVELPASEPVRAHLDVIKKSVRRAADLTRQMLAYSGEGKFVVEPVSLSQVVEESQKLLAISVSKKATLTYNLAADLPPTLADASQIHQVILNIVINASEALNDQCGEIAISTDTVQCDRTTLAPLGGEDDLREGLYVRLKVVDTGCGMDQQTLKKIFDPFYTTKLTGRGMGLAAVHGIVRGHKGVMRVESEPGKGTTFQVLFPASEATIPLSVGESPAAKP
jgi:PAS domain S-box-containing protein